MGQCRTSDVDVTIGCYNGVYSSCDYTIPASLLLFFAHTCLPPFLELQPVMVALICTVL